MRRAAAPALVVPPPKQEDARKKMNRTIAVLLAAGLLGLPGTAAPQAFEPAPLRPTGSENPLRPGDVIRLQIWQEPEMSGEYTINDVGVVTLPRLGRMEVTGLPPAQLERQIVEAYDRLFRHSSIEVRLLRRVQILGAVRQPGLYPVDATMTVSDALALAGGATPQGEMDRIELIRNGERIDARLSIDTRIADSPLQSGDQIFVPERSWFERHSGALAAGMMSLLIAFLTR